MCYILLKQVINLILASKMMLNIFPVSSSWTCTEYSQLFVMSTAIHTVHVFTLVPQVQCIASLSVIHYGNTALFYSLEVQEIVCERKEDFMRAHCCRHTVEVLFSFTHMCIFFFFLYTCVGTCGFLVFVSSVFVSPLLTLSVLLQHCALLL